LIHVTKDGGGLWTKVTPMNLPRNLMINCIEPDPFNEAGCYVAGTAYKSGDFRPYILKTENYGKSWKKIVNGIDMEHFTRAVRADPSAKGVLYAGTETGMYVSFNDGQSWKSMQLNLPIVPITDLAIKEDNLIAATQGRGIWIIDDLDAVRQMSKMATTATSHLFKPRDSYSLRGRQNKNVKGAGMNHPGGVMTYYYLKNYDEKKDTIHLTYVNKQGDTIRTFSNHAKDKTDKLEVEQGGNMFSWNMRHENAYKFDGMILWWGSLNGATVLSGAYQVSLEVNGETQTQPFNIIQDPRITYTDQELKQQYDFINQVNAKVTESHKAIEQMTALKKQMSDFKEKHDTESIKNKILEIDSTLTDIQNELYQTKNQSRQDPLNFPIKLTNKLAHLNSLIQISKAPPTDQMVAVKEELEQKIEVQLQKYNQVLTTDIKELNKLINAEITEFIKVERK